MIRLVRILVLLLLLPHPGTHPKELFVSVCYQFGMGSHRLGREGENLYYVLCLCSAERNEPAKAQLRREDTVAPLAQDPEERSGNRARSDDDTESRDNTEWRGTRSLPALTERRRRGAQRREMDPKVDTKMGPGASEMGVSTVF